MQTERRKLRQLINQFLGAVPVRTGIPMGWDENLADEIIKIFDETRPINRYRQDAMLKGIDLEEYPADVAEITWEVCKLWTLRPPRNLKQKVYWIDESRALMDACGEYGLDTLRSYRTTFEEYMSSHQGLAPFTVSGPGSLVKAVRAHAGTLRSRPLTVNQTFSKPNVDGSFYG